MTSTLRTRCVLVARGTEDLRVPVTVGLGGHNFVETGLVRDSTGHVVTLTRAEEEAAVVAAMALLEAP